MKLKILTILGTRPEIIRLSQIIKKLEENFIHKLVHTRQNYDFELNDIFFKEMGIKKPNYSLKIKNSTPIEFISNSLLEVDKILEKEKPDAVLVLGDTNSALSILSAKKRKIPIFHIEAGNRCFDENVPEEINRRIIDHVADINLTYSSYASRNLLQEGLHQNTIIKIGSPLLEVYIKNSSKIEKSDVLKKNKLTANQYILVSIHREENVDYKKTLTSIIYALKNIKNQLNLPIIFSSHPRILKNIKKFNIKIKDKKIKFFKPFGFFDYVKLMKNSKLVISDSGSITEETSILSIPSLNIRNANERQEGMEYGTVIMTGTETQDILNSTNILLRKYIKKESTNSIYPDYAMNNVSEKVVTIIQSYTGYVKKRFIKN